MSKVQLAGNASGTGIFQIASPNSNTDRTLTLPDNTGTLLSSASTFTQNSGPTFSAYAGSNQVIGSANTFTKMLFQTEEFDTASCYNNTGSTVGGIPAYAFLPNVAGYYFVNLQVSSQGAQNRLFASIYKNGSGFKTGVDFAGTGSGYQTATSALIYFNGTTDYVEAYGYFGNTATLNVGPSSQYFQAFLVRT